MGGGRKAGGGGNGHAGAGGGHEPAAAGGGRGNSSGHGNGNHGANGHGKKPSKSGGSDQPAPGTGGSGGSEGNPPGPAQTPPETTPQPNAGTPNAPGARGPSAAGRPPRTRAGGGLGHTIFGTVSAPAASGGGAATPAGGTRSPGSGTHSRQPHRSPSSPLPRVVRDVVEVIPAPLKAALAALGGLALALASLAAVSAGRARRLRRNREQLLADVGLLQSALLPEAPPKFGALAASVAYRPADGPAAGGDFYEVAELRPGVAGIIVGDVAGHGRTALARTALLRHSLLAYLQAGLAPRAALRLLNDVLPKGDDETFATVAAAVHDTAQGTLTYACAGHPPPIVLGRFSHRPVIRCSSPPLGLGLPTGRRETELFVPKGSLICFYTDGLVEARKGDGVIGRDRLTGVLAELGDQATAPKVLDRVRREADRTKDDMAACVLRVLDAPARAFRRTETLELQPGAKMADALSFLRATGMENGAATAAARQAAATATGGKGAVLQAQTEGGRTEASVLPAVRPRRDEELTQASRPARGA